MDQHYKNFVTTFYKFIYDLNRYVPNDGCKQTLEIYTKLDMAKVIFRLYNLLKKNENDINNKNENIFNNTFVILPGIDISEYWSKLIKGQKEKIWTYLTILLLETDLLVNSDKEKPLEMKQEPVLEIESSIPPSQKKLEFDPFVGVGSNDNTGFSVDQMFSSVPTMEEDKPDGPGIETIASIIGIDKMINMEELSNQLKNMKEDDIENATKSIKEYLGTNVDEKTTNLISDMLTSIKEEMNKGDIKNGNPLKTIMSIAETVAGKMRPSVENNGIDMAQLLNTTQAFANQCKDKDGKPMFDGKMNPFMMINQLAGMTTNGNNPENNPGNISEEQYMNQCNAMLQQMGMGNIDIRQLAARGGRGMPRGARGGPPRGARGGRRKKR